MAMRRWRVLGWVSAALGLLWGLAGCGGPDIRTPEGRPDGRKIYVLFCASCHGSDGRNDRNGSLKSMDLANTATKPDAEVRALVLNGRGQMPPWKNRLKDDEIAAVLAYVNQLVSAAPAGPRVAR